MDFRYSKILTAVCMACALVLAGCGREESIPATEPSAIAVTDAPAGQATQPPTTPQTEIPTEAPTEMATEEPAQPPAAVPYLQKVSFADQSIYAGPGYDYVFAGTVKEAGTYTIVEETRDADDTLWGKLKSGAGWINLTEVRQRLETPEALSANYADDLLLESGDFHHCIADPSDFAVQVAFRAHEPLTDVTLFAMEFTETMELAEELYSLPNLDPGRPLVANLGFPGDITSYAIRFSDSSGTVNCWGISISGRNGALELWNYEP